MSFNVNEFLALAEEVESRASLDQEEPSDDFDCAETIHALLVKVLRKLPTDLRVPVGTLFSMSLQDETIFQIDTVEDLLTKLELICPTKAQAVQVSKRKAKQCLGVDTRNVEIDGIEYVQYSPISGTIGETVLVGRLGVDTFSTLLVDSFITKAKDVVADNFTHLATDDDSYEAAAQTGGKYRPFVLIIPDDDGVLHYQDPDPTRRVVYEVTNGSRMDIRGKVVPLSGELLSRFCVGNAYTNQEMSGGVQSPDGNLWIQGPYDPLTFVNDHPDSSTETFSVVLSLFQPNKKGLYERYVSEFVKPQEVAAPAVLSGACALPRVTEARSSDFSRPPPVIPKEYYRPSHGIRGRGPSRDAGSSRGVSRGGAAGSTRPVRAADETPHWRTSLGQTKTISPECTYTWSGDTQPPPEVAPMLLQQDARSGPTAGLVEEASQALLWLKQQPGCQLSDVADKFPNTHAYAVSAIEQIGEGNTKKRLLEFIRTFKKARQSHQHATLASAADDAENKGVLPGVMLMTPEGEIEASSRLTLCLFLLKLCASLVFTRRAGPLTQFYWQEKKY